ncbi:insulinase family protein [Candidatus Acetothermia bacterium]|nr:insulinase family protein [Candidatus Acetothermia bacterium]
MHSHAQPLENGLTILGEPTGGRQSVAFSLLVPCGSTLDTSSREGTALLLQDYLFKGTGNLDAKRLAQKLDALGLQRSQSVDREFAIFSGVTLSKNLRETLKRYAQILRKPNFPPSELESLRSLALQSLDALEDSPMGKLFRELLRKFFPMPLSNSPGGTRESLNAIQLEDIYGQFERGYIPQGAIMAFAGNIDWKDVTVWVQEFFGDWTGSLLSSTSVKAQPKSVTHLEKDSEQVQIGIAYEDLTPAHKDYLLGRFALNVLRGGMSSRLFREVREKRGLVYTVGAQYIATKPFAGVACYAGSTTARAQETLDVMLTELRKLKDGALPDEFARARARLKAGLIIQGESSIARALSLTQDWFFTGKIVSVDERLKEIETITLAEVNQHLKRHAPKEFTIVTLGRNPLEVRV